MKQIFVIAAALAGGFSLSAHAATPPIASVACTTNITGCAFAADGSFPPQGQFYQTQTAYWTGVGTVTYTLTDTVLLTGLLASVDNNDDYRFEVSTNGSAWQTLTQINANMGTIGGGMDTFSTVPSSPFFTPGLGFAPATAAFVRITALNGDNLYSVGELTLFASAVPEPATAGLLVGGVAALAIARRRKPEA